jgi:gas vesicle protein
MAQNRNYSYKDVDMLLTSKTIAGNFKSNIAESSAVRNDWTEEYATNLVSRIGQTIETHLGIDAKKDLRDATSGLSAIQVSAKRDLSFFKTQIDDDFKAQPATRDEILNTLGFSKHLRGVQKGNQESLVQLLYVFKKNMTDSIRNQITAKGLSDTLIGNIIGYAMAFMEASSSQESLKLTTKEITKEVVDVFNGIYDEIIGICKKVSSYYQYDAVKKEQFTFSKVIGNLGSARPAATQTSGKTVPAI